MKKQIVFIEYSPMIHTLKMAKGLRESGKYETVLISFNKFDEKFFGIGYDKIIHLEVSQRPSPKNMLVLIKKIFNGEYRKFRSEIKSLNPYIVHLTGLGLFTFLSNFLINRVIPRVYYAYDVITYYSQKRDPKIKGIRNYSLSSFIPLLKRLEKYYFKNFEGIIHKGPENELSFLDYSVNKPQLTLSLGCLEEWTHVPKKKGMKEIHIAMAGPPLENIYYTYPFKRILKEITDQKIHLHTYGKSGFYGDYYLEEERRNPYFHYHPRLNPKELNLELSKYHYGLIPDFFNDRINTLWAKTSMGHKMSNFMEAGLPIMVSNDLVAMVEIVKKYGLGRGIDYEDIKNLRKILKKENYKKLQNNMRIAQKKLSVKNVSMGLAHFYEGIARRKIGNNPEVVRKIKKPLFSCGF